MAADKYWQARLLKDRKLAERAADEVAGEVKAAMRAQYLQVARRMDSLYAEAQSKGTLSRTKLWNYRAYRDLEQDLAKYCEAGSVIQREALTKALDRTFNQVIGAPVERFDPKAIVLPYSPRAFIDTAWSGENYSSRIWKNTNRLADQIRTEAQLVVQGLKSPGEIKRELMREYDVSYRQAERLIDTEISYVLNKANLEQYRRLSVGKVTIVNLDVNTCEKCKALENQVFRIDDAPVLPIHPRCHCSYCVPAEGDDAEVTASGADLDRVYADAGVKGYERVPAGDGRKITFSMSEIRSAPNVVRMAGGGPQAPAVSGAVSSSPAIAQPETEAAKTAGNTGLSGASGLRDAVKSGTMASSTEAVGDGVRTIAKIINASVMKEWGSVAPEVILTDERIVHIRERHPGAYESYRNSVTETIENPDYILRDSKNERTAAFIRHEQDSNLNVVVKLAVTNDEGKKSSIITLYPISSKRLKRLLRKEKVVYKALDT